MRAKAPSRRNLTITFLARLLAAIPALGLLFFLPAGTLAYWEAWVYMAVILIPITLVGIYLLRNNPELLERRLQTREQQSEQRLLIGLFVLFFLVTFLIPGFDRRFAWSDTPAWVVIAADILVLLGYGLVCLVFRENSYASRTVKVEQGQEVITSGPYSVVRHPMYLGILLTYGFSPLALGSYWGMIPMALLPVLLAARIQSEEQVLRRELEGYDAYTRQVKYRLIPGIW